MRLKELLDSSYDWDGKFDDSQGHGIYTTKFQTAKDEEVEVTFARGAGNTYFIEFSRDGTHMMTGGGDAIKIFSTVLAIIKAFTAKLKPEYYCFSAKNDEGSRVSFYKRYAKKIEGLGYIDVSKDREKIRSTRAVKEYDNNLQYGKGKEFFFLMRKDLLAEAQKEYDLSDIANDLEDQVIEIVQNHHDWDFDQEGDDHGFPFHFEFGTTSSSQGKFVVVDVNWRPDDLDISTLYDGDDEALKKKFEKRLAGQNQKKRVAAMEALLDMFQIIKHNAKKYGIREIWIKKGGRGPVSHTIDVDEAITMDDIPESGVGFQGQLILDES